MRVSVLEALYLKNADRVTSVIYDLKFSQDVTQRSLGGLLDVLLYQEHGWAHQQSVSIRRDMLVVSRPPCPLPFSLVLFKSL